MAKTNKTKPVEEIPCEFCKGIGFHGEFCPHRIKENWELEFDVKYPQFQKSYTWEKRKIFYLLQEQAEHFVELGEEMKKGKSNIPHIDTDSEIYNDAILDFQEAIRTTSLQATLIKNDKK